MALWGNAPSQLTNIFLQAQQAEQERQRQAQSIQQMFQALGLPLPQGINKMDPYAAQTVVNAITGDRRANANREHDITMFGMESGLKKELQTGQQTFTREQNDLDRTHGTTMQRNQQDFLKNRDKTTSAEEYGDLSSQVNELMGLAEYYNIDVPDVYTSMRPSSMSVNRLQKFIDKEIDRREQNKEPEISDYGQYVLDKAQNILTREGIEAYQDAIGMEGIISSYLDAIPDDRERMKIIQILNRMEGDAMEQPPQQGQPGMASKALGYFSEGGGGIPGMFGDAAKAGASIYRKIPTVNEAYGFGANVATRMFPQLTDAENRVATSIRKTLNEDGKRAFDQLIYGRIPIHFNQDAQNAYEKFKQYMKWGK